MMIRRGIVTGLIVLLSLPVAAQRRFPAEALRQDFEFLTRVLEKAHPSLYWYTNAEELHRYFAWAFNSITDSMNEVQFRNLVSYAVSKIRCGHTAVKASRSFTRTERFYRGAFFPFNVRVWSDTMVVSHSLLKGDSGLLRGTQILSINGRSVKEIIQSLYEFMPVDGFSLGVNEIRLSYSFPSYYRTVFGSGSSFRVQYLLPDSLPGEKDFPAFMPMPDTAARANRKKDSAVSRPKPRPLTRKQRKEKQLLAARSFRMDTLRGTGIMEINTFSNGNKLRSFYRSSFRRLAGSGLQNLIVDIRDNGGGNIRNYILLTKYLRHTPFRVADTVVAITKKMPTLRYMESGLLNEVYMMFSAKRMRDDRYHFLYFEKHRYKPRTRDHYNGNLYIITSGQTFSAATLFASALKGQKNCTIVGEETGGGAYGNNGMLIPSVTLPNSRIRITLPIFRMVISSDETLKGHGVMPDVEVKPSVQSIRYGIDAKMERALSMISGAGDRMDHNNAAGHNNTTGHSSSEK